MTDTPTHAVIKFLLEGIRAREAEAVDYRARRRTLQLDEVNGRYVKPRDVQEVVQALEQREAWVRQAEAIIAELQKPRPRANTKPLA